MCTMDSSEPYVSSIHFKLEREREREKERERDVGVSYGVLLCLGSLG